MAYATVSGIPVLAGCLMLPRCGAWSALVRLDTSETIPSLVDIDWGGLKLKGAFVRGGFESGSLWCRIVGGQGGLGTVIDASGYKRPKVGAVLDALMSASGEKAASSITADLRGRQLEWFALMAGQTVGDALTKLADATNSTWRILPDGSVWMGAETWPESKAEPEEVEVLEVAMASFRLRVRMLDASQILPGQEWGGNRIDRIEHSVGGGDISTVLWLDPDAGIPAFLAAAAEEA